MAAGKATDPPPTPVDGLPHPTTGRPGTRIGRRRPAYHRVADELRARIVAGDLVCGQRLANETDLSQAFGVSRSTVREALRVLTSQHLVETLRGVHGGSFVTAPDPMLVARDLAGALGALAMTPELRLDDLIEARMLLEPAAARRAAERADTDTIKAISAAARAEPDRSDPSDANGLQTHLEFHQALLVGAGLMFTVMITPVTDVLRVRLAGLRMTASEFDEVRHCHENVAEHIARGEPDEAEEAMRRHLSDLTRFYQRAGLLAPATRVSQHRRLGGGAASRDR